jgi:hypothetical protein
VTATGTSCRTWAAAGSSWQFLAPPGSPRQFLAAPDSSRQLLAAPGSSWQLQFLRAQDTGRLYADVMQFQPLREFVGYPDGAALLSRYNVAQVQAALYRAVSMTVEATDDFKTILRYAKLARLMHEIKRLKVFERRTSRDQRSCLVVLILRGPGRKVRRLAE